MRELRLGVRDWQAVYRGAEALSALDKIDALTDLQALRTLSLRGCNRVSSFQPLAALSALQSLNLSGCKQLQDLQPLAALNGLQELNLFNGSLLEPCCWSWNG